MVDAAGDIFDLQQAPSETCFNLTGFVQPATVNLCNDKDDDGLMDRQLFACPEEIHYDYDEYKLLPASTPSLSEMFKLIDKIIPQTQYTH